MPEPPTGRKVQKALRLLGFVMIRQRGSHQQWRRGNLLVTLPVHRGALTPGTYASILRQARLTRQELEAAM